MAGPLQTASSTVSALLGRVDQPLAIIVVAGLILRLAELGAGLPAYPAEDETTVMGVAIRVAAGDLNPHWFYWPSLWLYTLAFTFGAFFLAGRAVGTFPSLHDFELAYFRDPSALFLVGRGLSALLGAATIVLVYRLGRHLGSRGIGLMAALLLAVSPLHVRYSHFMLTDVPMTFAICATFVLLLRAVEPPVRLWLAALAGGFAMSIKYPAAALLIPLSLAAVGSPAWPPRALPAIRRLGVVVTAMAAGFVLTTPFALVDFPSFAGGLIYLLRTHLTVGSPGIFDPRVTALAVYTSVGLPGALGGPAMVLAAFGLGRLLIDAVRRPKRGPLLVLSFVLPVSAVFMVTKTPHDRYLLPLLPFYALCAGLAVRPPGRASKWPRRAAFAGLVVVAAGPPLVATAGWLHVQALPDTRMIARQWLEPRVMRPTIVAIEKHGPRFPEGPSRLRAYLETLHRLPGEDRETKAQILRSTRRYRALVGVPDPLIDGRFLFPTQRAATDLETLRYSLDEVRALGVRYIILDSSTSNRARLFPALYPEASTFYDQLQTDARLVLTVNERLPGCTDARFLPTWLVDLSWWCLRYRGPTIMIFELGSSGE